MKTRFPLMLLIPALVVLATGCARNKPGSSEVPPADGEQVHSRPDGDFKAPTPEPGTPDDTGDIHDEDVEWLQSRLDDVYFAFDRSDLTQESRNTLMENAKAMREKSNLNVIVEGHCDERGTNEYNLALGDRRARAARDFLVSSGIPASRFSIVSYGEERPAAGATGHDEASWSKNRRAHFAVTR